MMPRDGRAPRPDREPADDDAELSPETALSDDELDQVVGGLMRTWSDGTGALTPRTPPHPGI